MLQYEEHCPCGELVKNKHVCQITYNLLEAALTEAKAEIERIKARNAMLVASKALATNESTQQWLSGKLADARRDALLEAARLASDGLARTLTAMAYEVNQ